MVSQVSVLLSKMISFAFGYVDTETNQLNSTEIQNQAYSTTKL